MPNHVHVLLPTSAPERTKRTLATELRAWTRECHPGQRIWEPLPSPKPIPDVFHLKRQIRYVHLNPCRSGLARDPLEWEWSTHRDVTGCVTDPWPDLGFLAAIFNTTRARLNEVVHRYVSSDPSVGINGTPHIKPPIAGEMGVTSISRILRAASMADRCPPDFKRGDSRNLAVQIASRFGMIPDPAALKMSRITWRRASRRAVKAAALQAALRILSDRRLLLTDMKVKGVE